MTICAYAEKGTPHIGVHFAVTFVCCPFGKEEGKRVVHLVSSMLSREREKIERKEERSRQRGPRQVHTV